MYIYYRKRKIASKMFKYICHMDKREKGYVNTYTMESKNVKNHFLFIN